MKTILLFLILISVLSCNHDIAIADIKFIRIEKDTIINDNFNLCFSSDIELINQFEKQELSVRLDCFFKNGKIIEKDYKEYKGYVLTSIGDFELIAKDSIYTYTITTFFVERNDAGNLSFNEVINDINNNEDCLSCAVNALGYLSFKNRYVSETMCLPKAALRKVKNKHNNKSIKYIEDKTIQDSLKIRS